MKTKFTKGNWTVLNNRRVISDKKTVAILHSDMIEASEEEIQANLKLIAAAPEMLEALDSARKYLELLGRTHSSSYEEIIEVIKKSTE